jgi:AraC family transcriptional activator of pobA
MSHIPLYDLPEEQVASLGFKLYHLKSKHVYAEKLSSIPLETNIPHRHNFYEICFFDKGGGVHDIDFNASEIKQMSLHFLSPGQIHLLSGTQENQGHVIAFTAEFLADSSLFAGNCLHDLPFFNPVKANHTLELNKEEYTYLLILLHHIASDYQKMGAKAREIIQGYLKILLLKCKYLFYQKQKSIIPVEDNAVKLISRFKHLVEQHYKKLHQVQQYSDLLCISPSHLNKCCKQVTGITASELIMQRILVEAKRLLIFTEISSKEIAYFLHFDDPAYFSRIFRKKAGYSPTVFKKIMRKKYQY